MAYTVPSPEQQGYSNEIDSSFIQIPLEGGLSRVRQDMYLPSHTVECTWFLTREEYAQFIGYFRTVLDNASRPFLIDLISDVGEPTTHKCRTLEGMPKLTQQKGNGYWVNATLECENNPTYTGTITYKEPNFIIYSTTNPKLVGPIVTGDTVRILYSKGIHPTGSTPLNLDGVYIVEDTTGFNVLELLSPASVNTDWTTLATLGAPAEYGNVSNGNVTSTVTRVPT